jgi:hypothetical protein
VAVFELLKESLFGNRYTPLKALFLYVSSIMKKRKTILISFVTIAFLSFALTNIKKQTKQNSIPEIKSKTQTILFNDFNSSTKSNQRNHSDLNRDEILNKSLKGYREETYWGNEHSISEKSKQLNDKEFNTFVQDELSDKDVNVFWGAEY